MQDKKELKLTVNEKEVLRYLLTYKDRDISINQIAKDVELSWVTVNKIIKKFEEVDLVEVIEHGGQRHYKKSKKEKD